MKKIAAIFVGLVCVTGIVATQPVGAAPIDDAMFALVSGDSAKAMRTLHSLADKGDIQAEIFLGDIYHDGAEGVPKDHRESTKWYRIVANQGVPIGQYDLGLAYLIGEGLKRNGAEALRLFRLAADQGYAKAQVQVGQAYLHHGFFDLKGVGENPAVGVMWLRRAAEQGDGDGQGLLGLLYEEGKDIPQDYIQAYMWDTLAISSMTSKGNSSANDVRASRDELVAKMSKAQIEEGQRRVENWKLRDPREPVATEDAGRVMTSCFIDRAKKYGGQTCQPPDTLVGAVIGSCTKEEAAYKIDLSAQHPNDPRLVDDVILQVHARMSNPIQATLLDSQIKGGRCR